ncbi:DNRLRE domain-containing protein [Nocardiopsis algeriensis]|uniref:DNRLRE domain-containing protein n=1 Tax=Nocardiopsis algeriensis TaxID=1478215 RepID=UPI003B42A3CA
MRRSLTRATAACAASALALALWAAAPVAAAEEPPSAGAPIAAAESPHGQHPGNGAGTTPADDRPGPAHADGEAVEIGSDSWTYVDRAFPDKAYDGTESASVGTGRLAWDRVYTRRALFRFPVDAGAPVDSAVLRVETVWSYDCHSDAHVQLHQVDPFGSGTTWNDQPAERALLDTRSVRGGRSSCPVSGGVEFDVTEAYRQAAAEGEPFLHLRLKERDESGSAGWRRFGAGDTGPVLAIEPGTAPAPDPGASAESSDAPRQVADRPQELATAGPADRTPAQPATTPPRRGTAPGFTGTENVHIRPPAPADPHRNGGGQARSTRWDRTGRPTAPEHGRQQDGDVPHRPRGPPTPSRSGTAQRCPDHTAPVERRRHRLLPMRPSAGRRSAPAATRGDAGEPIPERRGERRFEDGRPGSRSTPQRPSRALGRQRRQRGAREEGPSAADTGHVRTAGPGGALPTETAAVRIPPCGWAPHGGPGRRRQPHPRCCAARDTGSPPATPRRLRRSRAFPP